MPDWMVLGRTNLVMKDEIRTAKVVKFRPIACLPTTFKLLTRIIAEQVYTHTSRPKWLATNRTKGTQKRLTRYEGPVAR